MIIYECECKCGNNEIEISGRKDMACRLDCLSCGYWECYFNIYHYTEAVKKWTESVFNYKQTINNIVSDFANHQRTHNE